jgi:hypothetical protein
MKIYTDLAELETELRSKHWRYFRLSNDFGEVIKFNSIAGKCDEHIADIVSHLNSDATLKGHYIISCKRIMSEPNTQIQFKKSIGADHYELVPETKKNTNLPMNTDAIIELATAKVEIKYLTKNNDELKTIIAKLEAKIQELETDSPALADNGNSFMELADKFAPTINTLAEAIINKFMPSVNVQTDSLAELPSPVVRNEIKTDFNSNANKQNSQKINGQVQKQIVRGSEDHYNFIRNSILSGALEDENKANKIDVEISELQSRNPELYQKLINEFEDDDTEELNTVGESGIEESEDA